MARIEKTVFISYRRADVYTALAVYENLKNQGYDVFFDYRSISSGDFEQIITSNIRARAHFLLILTPTALDRINEPGDWLRREIETAIDEKRNIVPLFFRGFRFGVSSKTGMSRLLRLEKPEVLTGKLKDLSRYNGLNVHEDYFEEAMHRLRNEYLNKPLDTVLHPVSNTVQKIVREEQVAADKALEQIEDVKELIKKADEMPEKSKPDLASKDGTASPKQEKPARISLSPLAMKLSDDVQFKSPEQKIVIPKINLRQVGLGIVALLLLVFMAMAIKFNPFTFNLGIGSTMTGEDGMTLLYVPAGEFTMGSDNGGLHEKPVHTVDLDAFWIDKTEVTNAMYAKCVEAGECNPPDSSSSNTHTDYFGNSEFDDYPVLYVSWNDASAYCSWAGRRLPTEAEWEKAARGENANVYPWGDTFDGSIVNFCDTNCSSDWADKSSDDGFADVAPVGIYPNGASPYGALDMAGNVWEWVNDWYSDIYDVNSPKTNPLGPDSGQARVLRGGSWNDDDYVVRSANRHWGGPSNSDLDVGFRCSRSP
jgi:formylglycine-generating enzyme required for sulfatase activity